MNANTKIENNQVVHVLELTEIEMHIISKALVEYMRFGYQPSGTKPEDVNVAHMKAAEQFHDEFLEAYCK